MTARLMNRAAADWLADAQPDPDGIRQQWADRGWASLLTGRNWDVVELPADRFSTSTLAGLGVTGPVVHVPGVEVLYVLVPPGTARWWVALAGVRVFGEGHQVRALNLPDPGCDLPDGARWITPPDGTGYLTDPELLYRTLVDSAAEVIR